MKVWKIIAPGSIVCDEITDAATPSGYAKIKIVRSGISVSDLNVYRGNTDMEYPIVPGHQAMGIVSEIETPNAAGLEKGQRVVIAPYLPCGKCLNCKDGHAESCAEMKMMGITEEGLLRDFAVVPVDTLYEIPKQIKDDEAIFTEHVAMAMHIYHDLGTQKGDHIAIIGASIIGLILAQIALYYQAIPILIDSSEFHIQAAKATGVYYPVNSAQDNALQKILQITGGRGCERVAYLTAANEKFQHALSFAQCGGTVAVMGWDYSSKPLTVNLTDAVKKRLTVIGINNAQAYTTVAINMLANKAVDVMPLLSKVVEFDDVPEIFRDATENPYRYNKVIVKI